MFMLFGSLLSAVFGFFIAFAIAWAHQSRSSGLADVALDRAQSVDAAKTR